MAGGFQTVSRLRGDDVLASPGSPRERGRNSRDAIQQHLDEIDERRQAIPEGELTPDEVRPFRERRQGA